MYNYKTLILNFGLSEEQKKLLDKRLGQDKTKFVPAEEALNEMREKYGL